jgi:hypothetical protein
MAHGTHLYIGRRMMVVLQCQKGTALDDECYLLDLKRTPNRTIHQIVIFCGFLLCPMDAETHVLLPTTPGSRELF